MSAERLTLAARLARPGFALDVDTELTPGAITALFGPSGSGKSTLLRVVAGFERPSGGRIALGERTWYDSATGVDIPPHRRPVGLMFQDARLFDHLDVAGNLDYAEKRSRDRQAGFGADEIVAALDLGPLLRRDAATLSGGERQRVALGRTLLTRPSLLLLDEPLAALDRERKEDILPYLERLPRRFGIPTIYVSHSIDEVARLAEQVLVLAEGRVQALGPTAEIVERLDLQPLTGAFEGGVLLEGHVVDHDARRSLTRVDIGGEELVMPRVDGLEPGEAIRLRVRARDVALATRRPESISIRNVLPATVDEIATADDGAFAEVFVRLSRTRLRARLTRASVEDLGLRPGVAVFALVKTVSFDRRLGRGPIA